MKKAPSRTWGGRETEHLQDLGRTERREDRSGELREGLTLALARLALALALARRWGFTASAMDPPCRRRLFASKLAPLPAQFRRRTVT